MSDHSGKKEVTVIMPALNEEASIINAINATLNALDFFKINGEVVVINDGSTDRTQALIEEKHKEDPLRVRFIQHDRPCGIGFSFWEGVDYSNGDFVLMLPGDNENDPIETLRYYRLLEHVDIVIPFIFNKEIRPLFRNILSYAFRFIINSTFLVNFNYTNGTVLYRKSILKELNYRSSGFFFQTDILVRAVKKGYLFAEVPYRLGVRKKGVSKAISFPSLVNVIKGYLRLVKDYYFSGKKKDDNKYCQDSQTAIRRAQKDSTSHHE